MPQDINIKFFIDESALVLPQPDTIRDNVKHLCELLEFLRQKIEVGLYSGIYETEILLKVLQDTAGKLLPRDLRLRFIITLGKCHKLCSSSLIQVDEFIVNGATFRGYTLSYTFQCSLKPSAVCCLGFMNASRPQGWIPLRRSRDCLDSHLYFASKPMQWSDYHRHRIEHEDLNADDFIAAAADAFPNLHLLPILSSQFRKFSINYTQIRPDVVDHLACLNDHFSESFERNHGQPASVAAEMNARYGINMSPESPNTHKNKKAVAARTVVINGVSIICDWHTKIKPDIDRIHFRPGNPKVANGRIIIGIFADHLTT